jgi:diacylglycerol kinase family enzyme
VRVTAIVNESGGTASAPGDQSIVDRVREAFGKQGIEADVRTVAPKGLSAQFDEAAKAGADIIVAGGGDGTISCAAGAAVRAGVTLGVLPLGTLNHFARDAGIPVDLDGAVAVIAAGHSKPVDVAEVNGRIFINNSSIGLYPMMVGEREAQQKSLGRSKRLAMLVASMRSLRHFRRHLLTIKVAGQKAPILTPLLFVGNNRYETNLLRMGKRLRIDGDELCLYAVLAQSPLHLIGLALRGIFGRLKQQHDFVSLDSIEEAEIGAHSPSLDVSTDGETELMETPLRYRIRPGALRLLVPAPADAAPERGASSPRA